MIVVDAYWPGTGQVGWAIGVSWQFPSVLLRNKINLDCVLRLLSFGLGEAVKRFSDPLLINGFMLRWNRHIRVVLVGRHPLQLIVIYLI